MVVGFGIGDAVSYVVEGKAVIQRELGRMGVGAHDWRGQQHGGGQTSLGPVDSKELRLDDGTEQNVGQNVS